MRSDLGKAVRREFEKKMKNKLPQFNLIQGNQLYPGDRLYCWNKKENLSFYIRLVIDPKGNKDSFTVELGWSRNNQPPIKHILNYQNELNEPAAFFRLSCFWSSVDPWWELWHDNSFDNLIKEFQKGFETELETLKRVENNNEFIQRYALTFGYEEPIESIMPNMPNIIDDVMNKIQNMQYLSLKILRRNYKKL